MMRVGGGGGGKTKPTRVIDVRKTGVKPPQPKSLHVLTTFTALGPEQQQQCSDCAIVCNFPLLKHYNVNASRRKERETLFAAFPLVDLKH